MAKKKTNDNTTRLPSQPPKQWNRLLGYSWRNKEPDIHAVKDLANRMRAWAILDTSFRISDFFDSENVPSSSFHTWLPKFEDLQLAYEFTLRRIASRRWHLAFSKQADRDIFKLDQHLYEPEWGKEVNEYWAALRKQDAEQPTNIHVHMDTAPNSDKVKPKKEEE